MGRVATVTPAWAERWPSPEGAPSWHVQEAFSSGVQAPEALVLWPVCATLGSVSTEQHKGGEWNKSGDICSHLEGPCRMKAEDTIQCSRVGGI